MGTINVDDHRKLSLANLTLELLKVVVLGAADDFFFDFEMNPLSEAFEMNSSA